LRSESELWFNSRRIASLIRSSALTPRSAPAKASTITAGEIGLPSVSRSGRPSRLAMPRLRVSSSSWQKFSTLRRMLPVITDSSITEVSISVSLVASTLEKSALVAASPEILVSTCWRSRRSNSAISTARSLCSARRAAR
jgi:hypothetical protein